MLIWYPANLAVYVDDATLSRIVPLGSTISPGCETPLYQRTTVYATCDFISGANTITGVDVSSLVTFTSSSSSVIIVNNYVQVGWHPRHLVMCSGMCGAAALVHPALLETRCTTRSWLQAKRTTIPSRFHCR